MRIMMVASMPVETFNAAVKDGSAQAKMKKIMDQLKPEAAYYGAPVLLSWIQYGV